MIKGAGKSIITGVILGVVVALIVSLMGAGVMVLLISAEMIGQDAMAYASAVVWMLSSFAGSMVTAGRVKRLRLQVCMLAAAGYYIFLMAITALVYDGMYAGMGLGALMITLGALAAAFLGNWRKKGPKLKIKNKAFR